MGLPLSACVRWIALALVVAVLLEPVNCGEVRIQTFTDKAWKAPAENFDLTVIGSNTGGAGSTFNVRTFESAIVSLAVDVGSVIACQRGFACNGAGANQISFLDLGDIGLCITGNQGTQFDKILVT